MRADGGSRMILGTGQAPGKVILFGEHAVVYGRPALAVPVSQVAANAQVESGAPGSGLTIEATDLARCFTLDLAPDGDPLAAAVHVVLAHLGLAAPDWRLTIHSTIPIASGLGSGAAVSAAIMRALACAAGQELLPETLSGLVYEVEVLYHGTPSGVDNTVIAHGRPVFFMRGQAPQVFPIGQPFRLVIADSGIGSPTKVTVGEVRLAWQRSPERFEKLFDEIGRIVEAARVAIASGEPERLGSLMDANHELLVEMGVSCPQLDRLVATARCAGAGGAKLSGGGRGGNMIALVSAETARPVAEALRKAGAVSVIVTPVGEYERGRGRTLIHQPGR
jgi:mevalonate kinase